MYEVSGKLTVILITV